MLGVATMLGAGFLAQHSFAQSANCSYSISNEWNTGATGAITITNTGTAVINGWTVGWQYTTNRISSSWNANVSGSNPYSASNIGWNGTIQPGQNISFGFQVDKRGGSAEHLSGRMKLTRLPTCTTTISTLKPTMPKQRVCSIWLMA